MTSFSPDGPPAPQRPLRLLALLGLLAALFILPPLAVQYWIYQREWQESVESELLRTQTRGRTIAALVDQEFESTQRTLRSIASRPSLRGSWVSRDLPGIDRHLTEARSLAPEMFFAGVFDLQGIAHRVAPDDPIVGWSFAHRDWFRGVTATRKPYVSEVYRTRVRPQRLVVSVAVPLLDTSEEMAGILMGAVSLENLQRRLEETQQGVVGEPMVVDQRGHIVVARSFTQGAEPALAPDPDLVAQGLAGREAVSQVGQGEDGYLASVTPIPTLGWFVLYRRTNQEAFGNVFRTRRRLVTANVYLGLIFLATVGVGFHLARRQETLVHTVRQSEERYRLLFDSSPLPLWLFDVETRRFLAVNQAATHHYGYTRDEFLSMSVTDIRPAEDVPRFLDRLAASEGTSGAAESWRHRTKDGTVIDVEVFSHRLTFGGRPASLVMVNDVSELRRHRQELQTLLDRMTTMVARVAPDGRLLQVNRTAELASGLTLEELLATHFLHGPWWAFDPDVQARVGRAFAAACAGTPVSYEERIRVFGQVTHISFSLAPVTGADGTVEYVVAEGRDVTAQKTAEAALQVRSRELEALNHELEAFTYSVSHDLRAPLRAVAGFARILEEDYAARLDGDGLDYLRRIIDGARQMGVLIDDLLNLSRIGRTQVERQPTDLTTLVEDVRRRVTQEVPNRRIEWHIEALPQVECDERLMSQVFMNLLSNAVKYTRPRDEARITVGTGRADGQPCIFVRDNGVGFDMKYAHKLFGVFQRLHDSSVFEGTGVGLATVQRIVHRHGGRIWAEAAVDEGATFFFTLDAAAAARSPVTAHETGGEA